MCCLAMLVQVKLPYAGSGVLYGKAGIGKTTLFWKRDMCFIVRLYGKTNLFSNTYMLSGKAGNYFVLYANVGIVKTISCLRRDMRCVVRLV